MQLETGLGTIIPDPTTNTLEGTDSLADVVSAGGTGALVDRIIREEGHSPAGVANNPGNIKFVGAPGQIDSGVHATDGGTFASYQTPEEGRGAITSMITRASQGQIPAYGNNPTVASFLQTYQGKGPGATNALSPHLVAGGGAGLGQTTSLPSSMFQPVIGGGATPTTPAQLVVNMPTEEAPATGTNPMQSLLMFQMLSAMMAGTHKFTPVDYDPWKVAQIGGKT